MKLQGNFLLNEGSHAIISATLLLSIVICLLNLFCRALLGSYGATPLATSTPQRTPRTPAMGFDPIMQQAENLARMSAMSTPLAGGENPSLHPTDFSGATPKMQV